MTSSTVIYSPRLCGLALAGALTLTLPACAELKTAGKTIGHTTKEVTKDIGHGTRDAAKAVGKGTKRVVKATTEEIKK